MKKAAAYLCLFVSIVTSPTSLDAQPPFALNGAATEISQHCYRLTSSQNAADFGSAWCEVPVSLDDALDLRFVINLGCESGAGEGIAFVMQQQDKGLNTLGCSGRGMGFARTSRCAGIQPSLAVEVDTHYDYGQGDIVAHHLALVRDGKLASPLAKAIRASTLQSNLLDCEYHELRITWQPSTQQFKVYFDKELRINYHGDLKNEVFYGKEEVLFGFTGSTGPKANMQMVCVQSVLMEIDEAFERKRSFEESINIYPNPARERLTIDITLPAEENVRMQLFDQSGRLIYEIPTHLVRENSYAFNMPGLPSGVYYVTVTNGTNRVSKKIVHLALLRA